jgi:hypothetical protein
MSTLISGGLAAAFSAAIVVTETPARQTNNTHKQFLELNTTLKHP